MSDLTTEYLITDIRTLDQTWVAAATVREALIAHENLTRAVPLPATTKVGREDTGPSVIIAWCGNSSIRGRRENVVRTV